MKAKLAAIAGLFGFGLATLGLFALVFAALDALTERDAGSRVVIGSKADTEGLILGEIMAALIERRAGLPVQRRTQLGGTQICFQALTAGAIDLYPEYTGTALIALLGDAPQGDAERTFRRVRERMAERFGFELMPALAFNNTYALTMAEDKARALAIHSISDLARHPSLRAGFTAEFMMRQDGYPGLAAAYGFRFTTPPRTLEAGLMYDAVASGHLDVIAAYATDGRIEKFGLRVLSDDRRFFPPYQAAPLLGRPRDLALREKVRRALGVLAGRLSDEEMRRLNARVDSGQTSARAVAEEFVDRLPP